jgi:hypothetical protein
MNRRTDTDMSGIELKPIFAEVVQKAADLGWRVARGETNQSLILSSVHVDGPPVTIVLPINERSINGGVLRGWHNKLVRYADPAKVQTAAQGPGAPPPVEEPKSPKVPDLDKEAAEAETVAEVIEKADKVLAGMPTKEDAEVVPENRICRLCKPPTTWSSAAARGAHQKIHRREGREAALELILVTAQDALGVAVATPGEVEELQRQLSSEKTAHQTTIGALEASRAELAKVKDQYGELRAAVDIIRGV